MMFTAKISSLRVLAWTSLKRRAFRWQCQSEEMHPTSAATISSLKRDKFTTSSLICISYSMQCIFAPSLRMQRKRLASDCMRIKWLSVHVACHGMTSQLNSVQGSFHRTEDYQMSNDYIIDCTLRAVTWLWNHSLSILCECNENRIDTCSHSLRYSSFTRSLCSEMAAIGALDGAVSKALRSILDRVALASKRAAVPKQVSLQVVCPLRPIVLNRHGYIGRLICCS
jgi:hypothetical protein